MKRILLLFIPASLILASCNSSVRINTVEPSAVNIPKQFKKVLLINRTAEDPKYASTNKMERILTGDWSKRNPKVSFEILNGLSSEMSNSLKAYEVQILTEKTFMGTGNQQFAEPFAPAFIDSLCTRYGVDMVVSLETINLDVVSKANGTPATFNVVGIGMSTIMSGGAPTYTLMAVVKGGFRIYPADGSNLLDEFTAKINWDFGKDKISDLMVLSMMSNAKESMNRALRYCGSTYGYGLSPHPLTLHRKVYTRGSAALKSASRYTDLGKWDDALGIWNKHVSSSSTKEKKRCMYNIAVYYEVMGELDKAIKMAEACYTEMGMKEGLEYSNALRARKKMERKAAEQTGE
ncbi:MAG: hypothetical protein IT233_13435 [Bacteroidia bacterium]|nr:hypothetical protein [Bacteroidia bacterium]